MKKLILLLLGFAYCVHGFGQQDAQYTQFMFNKLSLNPGYAVANETACISCLHRSQWVGLEGAPTSQSLNARIPMFKKRIGLGFSINHDQIGPTNSWNFSMIYAYKVPIAGGNLGLGLQGTLRSYAVRFTQTEAGVSGDATIPDTDFRKTLPNFGAGLYYQNEHFYIGLSIPHFLNGDLTAFEYLGGNSDFGREENHNYLMAGVLFRLSERIKLKPAMLLKQVKNAPIDLDFNTNIIFFDRLWVGATYRLGGLKNDIGESVDFMLQYQFTDAFKIGVAYDYTLSKVRTVNSGTYELVMEYCINGPNRGMLTNPRFF